jgi:hypothetical protein
MNSLSSAIQAGCCNGLVHRHNRRRSHPLLPPPDKKENIMRNILMTLAAATLVVPAGAVLADPPGHAKAYGHDKHKDKHRSKHRSRYDDRGRYYEPRRLSREDRIWRGNDGRYHCKRANGTTGLIIGGAVGALVGRELDGGRDRTVGTILGAAGGALLGREIDRGGLQCR